ncbi:unnamed protein product [Darwinula stevensoni]|uniref:Arsenite methyltransferase n=1 Tax=Darwinula stevensoni TaxID=69355 RepID=A0A7R9ADK6_9CRUS|nr:unnamed protein product [Darwinula stevensoni]CAG0901078.1 unnamed protein product [Darwinula stevensoni]
MGNQTESGEKPDGKRNYGCGMPFPDGLGSCKVLDLGCGTGRDAFVLSQLVGEHGIVVGVDMNEHQVAKAEEYLNYHMEKFGFSVLPNVKFKHGLLENLRDLNLKEKYFDVIVSNCVMNFCSDKRSLLSQSFNHLKVNGKFNRGGEMYLNDIYASCPIPESLQEKLDLWGECFSGALWWEDLHALCDEIGFHPPLIKEVRPVFIEIEELKRRADPLPKDLRFASVTYRIFKPSNDDAAPKAAVYDGKLLNCFDAWEFAHDLVFETGVPRNISKEYASILETSRFRTHFKFQEVIDNGSTHEYTRTNPFDMIPDPYESLSGLVGYSI